MIGPFLRWLDRYGPKDCFNGNVGDSWTGAFCREHGVIRFQWMGMLTQSERQSMLVMTWHGVVLGAVGMTSHADDDLAWRWVVAVVLLSWPVL